MDEVVRRPRAPLDQESSNETENVANVFVPSKYTKEFGSRLRYLKTFYRVEITTEDTHQKDGTQFFIRVFGKEAGVNAVVAAVNQWVLGCV